ncbi:hypothetical protein DFH09DRAFT_1340004 [Mycena vulgaris]|nr:hypothetical protein DFH09DRAFT_1340004 [Mycena vulgaris]
MYTGPPPLAPGFEIALCSIAKEQEHFRGGSSAVQIHSSNIDDRTMHEVYLWPFSEAGKADVGFVMCAYNKINQTQAWQNPKLINETIALLIRSNRKEDGVYLRTRVTKQDQVAEGPHPRSLRGRDES